MFQSTLFNSRLAKEQITTRYKAIRVIIEALNKYNVKYIFAYNANFDYRHLPELSSFIWIDILKNAAYRQFNDKLPKDREYCITGRLKTGYGVEEIYKILSNKRYIEIHNAMADAEDEFVIMMMLNKKLEDYTIAIINPDKLKPKEEPKECQDIEEVKKEKIYPVDINTLAIGDIIYHINFGKGTILELNDNKFAKIEFEKIAKTMNIEFCIIRGYIFRK